MSDSLLQLVQNATFQLPYLLWTIRIIVWFAAFLLIGSQIIQISKGKKDDFGLGTRVFVIILGMVLWGDSAFFMTFNDSLVNNTNILNPSSALLEKFKIDNDKGDYKELWRLMFMALGVFGLVVFYIAIFRLKDIALKKSNHSALSVFIMIIGAIACYNAEAFILGFGDTFGGAIQDYIYNALGKA